MGSTAYGEPVMVGGDADGAGAKPSDLLPLSLAACTAYDVVAILRKQRQRLDALTVEVTSVQDPNPPWTFRSIHTAFTLTGDDRRAQGGARDRPRGGEVLRRGGDPQIRGRPDPRVHDRRRRAVNGPDLRALLAARPLLADGGMGTWLLAGADAGEEPVEVLNRREPDRVVAAHRAFVGAGARLVLTNTFGANRYRLERHGLAGAVDDLVARGVPLARAAGAELVGGSIGPLGVQLQPYGRVPPEEALAAYAEQAAALVAAGVDVVVIETQTDLREMELAVRRRPGRGARRSRSRSAPPSPAMTARSSAIARPTSRRALADLGVDVIGVNCGEGPAQAARLDPRDGARGAGRRAGGAAERGRALAAGGPVRLSGHARVRGRGRRRDGGGRRPRWSADAAARAPHTSGRWRVRSRTHRRARPCRSQVEFAAATPPGAETDAGRPPWRARSRAGAFPIAVEMEPPRSFDASASVAAAATLREAGATVVDVADSPMAKMRMSAWAACRLIEERAGIETVLHFPTRGRNLVRLQGDLLGAQALGMRNLFVVVGDPVAIGDYPQALDDVDVTATGLLAPHPRLVQRRGRPRRRLHRRAGGVLRGRRGLAAAPRTSSGRSASCSARWTRARGSC